MAKKNRIEIGSSEWEIQHKPTVTHEGQDCLGLTEYTDKRISIADRHKDKWSEFHTFMHEYFHASVREYSLQNLIDQEKEEEFVDTLALALTLSIKHSKYLRDYLKKYV